MTTLDLTVACFATAVIHVGIAVFYSRKYLPIVGLAVHAYCPDCLTNFDEDPVTSAYPLIDKMSAAELRKALGNELRDLHAVCENARKVFMHVTDGWYANPHARAESINDFHDAAITDAVEYAVNDIRNEDRE